MGAETRDVLTDPTSLFSLPFTATKASLAGTKDVTTALTPEIPEIPAAPATQAVSLKQRRAVVRARDRIRERAIRRQPTLVTGPSGLATPATTAPAELLGQ